MSEYGEINIEIAEHESSAVMLGQAEGNGEENAGISIDPEPEMSDHMIPVGSISPLGRARISQESGVGENSTVESTHDFDVKVGISRRLQFENENRADFSFQQPSGNAADFLGFTDSPYLNSTLFSPKHSERRSALNVVFPQRMESSEESVRGSFDEVERKSASTISSDLQRNYAEFAESPQSMKPLLEPVTLNPEMLLQSKFSDKRKWNSETNDSFGNFVPSTAKKKRKKTSETGESNGCKRCNCKKTKCLKLYCDCFAAGVYCAESCACQACFNKPEYEDTVLETRQQIELRNPLAFAPKIIKNINETSSIILPDAGDFTPLSGRHKSGCNCKKSKCLKKYCECYQANVGCSDGCRCEGCENVHGRKLGYDMMKNLVSKQSISKKLDTSFGLMPSEGDFVQNQMYSPHNMAAYTPPAFQDPMRNGSPWFSRERLQLQQPGSDINLMTQVKQPEDSMRNGSPWFCRLRPPDSDLSQFRQVKHAQEELMNAASFDQNAYNMSNELLSPPHPHDGHNPQAWMPSLFGTNKLSEVAVLEDPTYPDSELIEQVPDATKVRSPKKKRISPPRGVERYCLF